MSEGFCFWASAMATFFARELVDFTLEPIHLVDERLHVFVPLLHELPDVFLVVFGLDVVPHLDHLLLELTRPHQVIAARKNPRLSANFTHAGPFFYQSKTHGLRPDLLQDSCQLDIDLRHGRSSLRE
jgi:hypothetical protein